MKHMDFEEVKNQADINKYAEQHLEHVRGGLVCPFCGSGTGPNHTPAFHITKENRFKCFSCGEGGDIFDLAGIVGGIEDKAGQYRAVCEWAGIRLEEDGPAGARISREISKPGTNPQGSVETTANRLSDAHAGKSVALTEPTDKEHAEGRARHAAYLAECRKRIHDPEAVAYLESRGITEEEAEALGFGYDPRAPMGWKDAGGAWHSGGRIVIPWKGSDYYHIDRAISGSAKEAKYDKPRADEVGAQPLYNPDALRERAFFIVEGALDAVAVELCGYQAIALGGTGARGTVEAMAARKPQGVAVVMLDGDKPGRAAAEKLADALDAAGIVNTNVHLPDHKDAAEWLAADREGLRSLLRALYDHAVAEADALREQRYNAALKSMRALDPLDVASALYALEDEPEPLPTGFNALDEVLNGGLQPGGLYALGAVSSFGKTTLAVQIADHIAEQGHSVLFVTIEQSAREIVAKSISRLMSASGRAYSTAEITSAMRRSEWGEPDAQRLLAACEKYSAGIARHLRIFEGTRQPGIVDIAAVAETMADHDGEPPAIFIDYLQLMAPQGERDSDKQAVDKNVMGLRQMARDLRAPVFVISSLNRSSYSEGVTMDAFKESGAIEYGSDVLIGLQPRGMREHMDGVKDTRAKREAERFLRECKAGDARECELVVLKNRNGRLPEDGLPLRFKPVCSRFIEEGDLRAPGSGKARRRA